MKLHEAVEVMEEAQLLYRRLSAQSLWSRYTSDEWRSWVAEAKGLMPGLIFLATLNERAGFLVCKLKHFADQTEQRLDAEDSVKALRAAIFHAQVECNFCGYIAPREKFIESFDKRWLECPMCRGYFRSDGC